jgi:hypothetical protein
MMNLNRWWKKGDWVGFFRYFERVKMSRIVLGV